MTSVTLVPSQELENEREGLLTLQDQSSGELARRMALATERERELAALKVTLEEREAQLEEVKHSLRLTDDGQVGGCLAFALALVAFDPCWVCG